MTELSPEAAPPPWLKVLPLADGAPAVWAGDAELSLAAGGDGDGDGDGNGGNVGGGGGNGGGNGAARAAARRLAPAWRMLLFGDGSPTRLLALLAGSRLAVDVIGHERVRFGGTGAPAGAAAAGSGGSATAAGAVGIDSAGGGGGAFASDGLLLDALAGGVPRRCVDALLEGGPEEEDKAGGEAPSVRWRRRVWLRNERGERLGYASSWWRRADLDALLPPGADRARPIGGALASSRLDVHRELLSVVRGASAELAREFRTGGRGGGGRGGGEGAGGGGGGGGGGGDDDAREELWARYYAMWRGGRLLCLIYECFSPRALVPHMGATYL